MGINTLIGVKEMKKKFLAILTVAIFALPVVLIASGPKGDLKVTKIGDKRGPAIYSHPKHEAAGVKECKQCHHKGSVNDPCAKCHKGIEGQKAIHKSCVDCHKKMSKGPVKCNDCHQKK